MPKWLILARAIGVAVYDVSGHYFCHYDHFTPRFCPVFSSVIYFSHRRSAWIKKLILQKLMGAPKNLVGHFWPPWRPFWILEVFIIFKILVCKSWWEDLITQGCIHFWAPLWSFGLKRCGVFQAVRCLRWFDGADIFIFHILISPFSMFPIEKLNISEAKHCLLFRSVCQLRERE